MARGEAVLRVPRFGGPEVGLAVRMSLCAGTLLSGVSNAEAFTVVPWVIAIAIGDILLIPLLDAWRAFPRIVRIAGVVGLAGLATVAAQVIPSLLGVPLLLVPAVHAGAALGMAGAVTVSVTTLAVSFFMAEFTTHHALHGATVFVLIFVVVLTSLIAGLWHVPPPTENAVAAHEARALLERLNSLSDAFSTGLDLPALGDSTIEGVAEALYIDRASLIIRSGQDAVPISLRGHIRMPWTPPSEPDSVLHQTWTDGTAIRRAHFGDGVRRFVLTTPLRDSRGDMLGLIAVDRAASPFSAEDEAKLGRLATDAEPMLEVALLFSRLRARAALEERSRLARDMHDGVAQELAALSYSVDTLTRLAAEGADVSGGLDSLRHSMRHSLGDIRHQISSLKMVERPDVSLGAILSSNLRRAGADTGARTTMSLEDSAFRFPAHVEVALNRLALDVLADARAGGATMIDMEVSLSAPNARLSIRHDGSSDLDADSFVHHAAAAHGEIIVEQLLPRGRFVEAALGSVPARDAQSDRSVPSPARSPRPVSSDIELAAPVLTSLAGRSEEDR